MIGRPFRYPKAKHTRKQTPPQYTNYRKYKPVLREEFGAQCVFCLLPDASRNQSFGVEHYRPKKRFPELATTYSNLFYACNSCNSRKGDYWPSEDQLTSSLLIVNPCDHVMFKHLRYAGHLVEDRTTEGAFTSERLDLNEPKVAKYRAALLAVVDSFESERNKLIRTIATIDARLARAPSSPELIQEKAAFKAKLAQVDGHLSGFGVRLEPAA